MSSVWVAMSGGVDSSVAAARLVDAGHDVTGVTMRLVPEGDEAETRRTSEAIESARRVCERLGIDHHVLDLRGLFEREVIAPFADAYCAGRTPNPCALCNDRVKFHALLEAARGAGADTLATGHYARILPDELGRRWLHRGLDPAKDQSYFLYRLTEPAIDEVVFPLGEATKADVRAEAARLGLPSAERQESQEVCFVPDDPGSFVAARCPSGCAEGPILDTHGEHIGTHRGLAHYTVGQRKGLGLPGGPWYVAQVRAVDNTVIVSRETPALTPNLEIEDVVWRTEREEAAVVAVVRYRAVGVPARVHRSEYGLELRLEHPIGRVAPGQAVVCYVGDRVVGGGVVRG